VTYQFMHHKSLFAKEVSPPNAYDDIKESNIMRRMQRGITWRYNQRSQRYRMGPCAIHTMQETFLPDTNSFLSCHCIWGFFAL